MTTYQKAFHLRDSRHFPEWYEDRFQSKPHEMNEPSDTVGIDGSTREELLDESIVFLQEDLVVTKSCFERHGIIFDDFTAVWEAYCKNVLKFEIPD